MRTGFCLLLIGCGGTVSSDAEAEAAALGLEGAIERALALGFLGFDEADSANIPEQTAAGDVSGTMVVTGQVDQGNSDNKGMRLDVALTDYADVMTLPGDLEAEVIYETDDSGLPRFDLNLRDIPDGTLEGSVDGVFLLDGDLEGRVTLALTLAGAIEADGAGGTRRIEGTTQLTGTATNAAGGTYTVDITL